MNQNDELIYIGEVRGKDGKIKPCRVTRALKEKMDAHPYKPKTDAERRHLAGYLEFFEAMLDGFTPGTPEYKKRQKQVQNWVKNQIEKEQAFINNMLEGFTPGTPEYERRLIQAEKLLSDLLKETLKE